MTADWRPRNAPAHSGTLTRMDGFEFNKIAGAVLSAMLVIAGGRVLLDMAMPHHGPEKPGWALPVTEAKAKTAAPEAAFDVASVLGLLPKANADAGADIFKKCMACHTGNKDGKNLVGPNLWGIVGRKTASAAHFEARYSEAMKGHAGEWTFERLASTCTNPLRRCPATRWCLPAFPITPTWPTCSPTCASCPTARRRCRRRSRRRDACSPRPLASSAGTSSPRSPRGGREGNAPFKSLIAKDNLAWAYPSPLTNEKD